MRTVAFKFALVLLISLSLVGAPCRDCQPRQDKAHCQHSCCPKPKPAQLCTWQPSDVDRLDTSQHVVVEAPPTAVLTALVTAPVPAVRPGWAVEETAASPPPLYLIHATLLI